MEIIQHNLFDGKVCRDCKQWKSYVAFFKKQEGRDGFYTRCKECWHIYMHAWRKRNPEVIRAANLRFVENNPDKVRGYYRKYRQNHPEKVKQQRERERLYKKAEKRARNRRWYHNNIDKIRMY